MTANLQRLGAELRDAQDEAARIRGDSSVEQRMASIQGKLAQQRPKARSQELSKNLAFALLGAAAAIALLFFLNRDQALKVHAFGEPVMVGEWVATEAGRTPLEFSDGTRLTFQPESRGRILELTRAGARVALEAGSLHAQVVPHENARWVVAAGPFEVLVTGTQFVASWDPGGEVLRVVMQEGSVRVSGSCLAEPRALAAGQAADFRCTNRELAGAPAGVGSAKSSEPPKPEAGARPTKSVPPVAVGGDARPLGSAAIVDTAGSAEPDAGQPSWQDHARAGRFKQALQSAESLGFSSLCTSASASEVLELGNVARLAGNPARANEAYLSARQRFGGSSAGALAAFQLGRQAFDGARDYSQARRWFSAYLSEQPGGSVSQEALGRLMECEQRLGNTAAAEAYARRYLTSSPNGAHAALARSITGE